MSGKNPKNEKSLIVALKRGDQAAFSRLFFAYEKKLYFFSYKLLQSHADAEEVVQEVFLRIWDKRATLDEQRSFNAYLITIAKNIIYNRASRKVTEHAYREYLQRVAPSARHQTEEVVNFSDLNTISHRFISQLPEKRRKIFLLSRFEGLNNQEIAQQLNISVSTVENQMNKALKVLKTRFSQYDIEVPLLLMISLIFYRNRSKRPRR
ncbi:MAG: RNA polymerase sigma-70 factor, partial [Bacteroidota bacterium]